MDKQIVISRLDTDYYKLTMGAFVHACHSNWPVVYRLTNRTTDVRLADLVDIGELREQLEAIRRLRLSLAESDYLAKCGFDPEFINWLDKTVLPDFDLSVKDGQFSLSFDGSWEEAIWWETPALAVINELYNRALVKSGNYPPIFAQQTGVERLAEKLIDLEDAGLIGKITEFGTRRRFSRKWQKIVLQVAQHATPKLFGGTSNVSLALETGLPARGTMAHELFMAYMGGCRDNDRDLRDSQKLVLDDWYAFWGEPLTVALSDTFGTRSFLEDFRGERAAAWRGIRHDSGNPAAFGEKVIVFYRDQGIDPLTKVIMFSDGLTADRIVSLEKRFAQRIGTAYGWGTNLTNDCGFRPLSLVIKLVESGGWPTVKLSDNAAKAMGPADQVERCKRVFGHDSDLNETCIY